MKLHGPPTEMMQNKRFFVASLLVITLLLSVNPSGMRSYAQDASPNRVALIIVLPDDILTACIEFGDDSVDSTEILMRADVDLIYMVLPSGGVICTINGVGSTIPAPMTVEQCLSECPSVTDPSCEAWWHWYKRDDQWQRVGASTGNLPLVNGDIEAWVWGGENDVPPDLRYDEICVAYAPTPTASPQPTATWTPTLSPTPTWTPTTAPPTATATHQPTATATITHTPTATYTPDPYMPTATRTRTPTPTPSSTPTRTLTPIMPTATPTPIGYPGSSYASPTPGGAQPTAYPGPGWPLWTPTATLMATRTPTRLPTPTITSTPTPGPSRIVPATPEQQGYPILGYPQAAPPGEPTQPGPTIAGELLTDMSPTPESASLPPSLEGAMTQDTPHPEFLSAPQPTGDRLALLLDAPLTPNARVRQATQLQDSSHRGVLWAILAFITLGLGYIMIQRQQRQR
jgi:hypothetical protein